MPIEISYESVDAVPETFRKEGVFDELFTVGEDGRVSLSGVAGLKTQKDVDAVKEALRKEREGHSKAKEQLKAWAGLDPAEVYTKLGRINELEALAGGKVDEKKLNELVEGRLAQKTGPLERSLKELSELKGALEAENHALKTSIETRDRNDTVRQFAVETKAHATALADIEMAASMMLERDEEGRWITKTGLNGISAGLDVKNWLKEMMRQRPHWWPESEGGGGRGGGGMGVGFNGKNPFSREHWNATKQVEIAREQGIEAAIRMQRHAEAGRSR